MSLRAFLDSLLQTIRPSRGALTPFAARASLALCCALSAAGCSNKQEPFEKMSKAVVDGTPNHGFVWFHHRPGAPLPGARYEAGFDTEGGFGLSVCRAAREGAVQPGKIVGQRCVIGWHGGEFTPTEFDVLAGPRRAFWHAGPNGVDVSRALVGGHDDAGKPIYVCVARYVTGIAMFATHHGYQPGAYSEGKCKFAWNGAEQTSDEFFVLSLGKPMGAGNSQASALPKAPVCMKDESPCTCIELTGCSRAGFCPCAANAITPQTDK